MTPELVEDPTPAELSALDQGLTDHARSHTGPHEMIPLTVLVRGDGGKVAAGLRGHTAWGWLQVKYLWVSEELRGRGLGRRIMEVAESEASKRGCHAVLVDTVDFQAPQFYPKLGYRIFGTLEDYPRGHTRTFLHKKL